LITDRYHFVQVILVQLKTVKLTMLPN